MTTAQYQTEYRHALDSYFSPLRTQQPEVLVHRVASNNCDHYAKHHPKFRVVRGCLLCNPSPVIPHSVVEKAREVVKSFTDAWPLGLVAASRELCRRASQ